MDYSKLLQAILMSKRSLKLHMKLVWQLSLPTMILTRHRIKMISSDVSAKCRI